MMNTDCQTSYVSHRPTLYKVGQWDKGGESGTSPETASGTADLKSLALHVLYQTKMGQARDGARDTLSQPLKAPGTAACTGTIPALTKEESQEVIGWPVQTQRVYTRLLDHFEARGFPLLQAERLSFTTLIVLKKRKGWPLILVSDLPPEIGRAIGYVLDAFPGTKLMNYRHKTVTAQ
ncbi:hypothetical protein FAK_30900 [Desulfoferula mesophila]|uniref:Uncharacterized protein n=1 Tax=Desulfoferula mesophila TaxID=3058419 RepID=A0AAU9EN98_9BACT|nr:hypothetical protein FAK_30900 [Desulfoferula mesophilus]